MNTFPRILVVHNSYQWRGGEDVVAEMEIALLRQNGHEVQTYSRHNNVIESMSKVAVAQETLWSMRTMNDLGKCITAFNPDLIHVHNTFPLVSPSLFWTAAKRNLPVVQTLHNFRMLCPQAMLLRNQRVCEDCIGTLPWRGVVRKCYRNSTAQSAVLVSMLALHRALGTYRHKVSRYIALNRFCRDKFVEGGLPRDRISIKPNFVDNPAPIDTPRAGGLFVGRLSQEKGIDVLRGALERLPGKIIDVIGEGPESDRVQIHARLRGLGVKTRSEIMAHMQRSSYLVVPSIWYETFGLVLVEAFACGLPAIATRLGAMQELIDDGRTGLLFTPGSSVDLANKIAWAESHPEEMLRMGRNAREEYLEKYTPQRNYEQLMEIYRLALSDQQVSVRRAA